MCPEAVLRAPGPCPQRTRPRRSLRVPPEAQRTTQRPAQTRNNINEIKKRDEIISMYQNYLKKILKEIKNCLRSLIPVIEANGKINNYYFLIPRL